jgi:ClpP class serine protease
LFDTLELAEAALLTRTQANKKKEVDELKKLYTAIIERENAVASQLVAL